MLITENVKMKYKKEACQSSTILPLEKALITLPSSLFPLSVILQEEIWGCDGRNGLLTEVPVLH